MEPTEKRIPKIYCGPTYLPVFFRGILSGVFNPACRLHDIHYSKGKEGLLSRKEADQLFLKNMIKLAYKKRKGFKLTLTIIMACAFYYSVRAGGYFSFKNRTK